MNTTKRNQYWKYKDVPHVCYACAATVTNRWCLNPPTFLMLCARCYARIVQQPNWRANNPEMIKQHNRKYRPRVLSYKGKRVMLKVAPRTHKCSNCGKIGYTQMHHLQYDDNDPLAYTVELCVICHRLAHGERDVKTGRWLG